MNGDDRTVNRRHRQGIRARRTAATRAAIRRAATAAFLAHGYGATTMRQVAIAADIGERTLYDAFGTKEALFQHVADVAIGGDEQPLTVSERPEFTAALAQRDPRQAVTLFAAHSAAVLERAGPIIMVAVESAGAEPAMRTFADQGAVATRAVAADFVRHLASIHPIADRDRAVPTVLAIVSPHVHQILRGHGRMGPEDYRDWLDTTLDSTLLARGGR